MEVASLPGRKGTHPDLGVVSNVRIIPTSATASQASSAPRKDSVIQLMRMVPRARGDSLSGYAEGRTNLRDSGHLDIRLRLADGFRQLFAFAGYGQGRFHGGRLHLGSRLAYVLGILRRLIG